MAGVEQNRYKTNNGCIQHLPQTGSTPGKLGNMPIVNRVDGLETIRITI